MERLALDLAALPYLQTALRLLGILLVAGLTIRVMRLLRDRLTRRLVVRDRPADRDLQLKARTLAGVIEGAGYAVIYAVAAMMAIRELGFDIAPLIASAGVVGIAIGFGAQALIRDLFTGFFIILEDQFAVDDIVRIGEHAGQVERLTLRITQLRNAEGALITIPNGEIKAVVNQSKQWSRVNLDIQVPFDADIDAATELLRSIGRTLAEDPEWAPRLLEEPRVLGIEQLGKDRVTLRMVAKTLPTRQMEVARELRRRIQQRARDLGGDLPLSSQVRVAGPLDRRDEAGRQAMLWEVQADADRSARKGGD